MLNKDNTNLNEKVRCYIEDEIKNRGFPEGKLPTERVLAEQLKVSRGTLRVALNDLEKNGLITRYRNKGTYLSDYKKLSGAFNKNLVLIFPPGFKQSNFSAAMDFYGEIYFSILNESSKNEYSLVTMSLDELNGDLIIEKCKNIKIDGFIFISSHSAEFVNKFKKFKKPILIVDHKIDELEISSVNINSYQGSFLAVQYLYDLGHRDIAFFNHSRWELINKERGMGFFDGLKFCGLTKNDAFHKLCKPDVKSGSSAMLELLALDKKPTAALSFDLSMGVGAVKTCLHLGVKIPEDFSIIAFRGYPTNKSPFVINTIDSVESNIGKVILNAIFHDYGDAKKQCEDILVDLKIVDQGSCRKIITGN